MFLNCKSLKNLNLFNFNTQKATDMSDMLWIYESLTNLDLLNFNTQNVTNMSDIFGRCNSLKKQNIITKDNNILKYI